jgi:hypothetical protein
MLLCAYYGVKNKSVIPLLISGVLMGVALQLQYIALFLGVILFVFVTAGSIMTKQFTQLKIILKSYAALAGGFILGWSPFIAFEIKHSFPNLRTIINYILHGNSDTLDTTKGFLDNIQIVFVKLFDDWYSDFRPLSSCISICIRNSFIGR